MKGGEGMVLDEVVRDRDVLLVAIFSPVKDICSCLPSRSHLQQPSTGDQEMKLFTLFSMFMNLVFSSISSLFAEY